MKKSYAFNVLCCSISLLGIICCIVIAILYSIGKETKQENNYELDTTTPIKERNTIDSIRHKNDTIKHIVDSLNTVKDENIEIAKHLDNDSTLDLWYKLLKE